MEEKQNLKLRGRIVEKYGTIEKFADAIGRDRTTISRVLCGKTEMSKLDRNAWAYVLDIPKEEIDLFFYDSGCENATAETA